MALDRVSISDISHETHSTAHKGKDPSMKHLSLARNILGSAPSMMGNGSFSARQRTVDVHN